MHYKFDILVVPIDEKDSLVWPKERRHGTRQKIIRQPDEEVVRLKQLLAGGNEVYITAENPYAGALVKSRIRTELLLHFGIRITTTKKGVPQPPIDYLRVPDPHPVRFAIREYKPT